MKVSISHSDMHGLRVVLGTMRSQLLLELIQRNMDDALEEAAKVAKNGCLVPPDGGSPTEDERIMCENIAAAIRALMEKHDD